MNNTELITYLTQHPILIEMMLIILKGITIGVAVSIAIRKHLG